MTSMQWMRCISRWVPSIWWIRGTLTSLDSSTTSIRMAHSLWPEQKITCNTKLFLPGRLTARQVWSVIKLSDWRKRYPWKISRWISPGCLWRLCYGKRVPFHHEPYWLWGTHHFRTLQGKVECRTFLQMDKATPAYQIVLWHLWKCRLYPNMDSCVCILAFSIGQEKDAHRRSFSLYDFSNHRNYVIWENTRTWIV